MFRNRIESTLGPIEPGQEPLGFSNKVFKLHA